MIDGLILLYLVLSNLDKKETKKKNNQCHQETTKEWKRTGCIGFYSLFEFNIATVASFQRS